MDNQPIIVHICRMLADLDEGGLRAVYMIVRQIYDLQSSLHQHNIPPS